MRICMKRQLARLLSRLENHPKEVNLLSYRDGELSPREQMRVEKHLKRCILCRNTLASLEMDIRTFAQFAKSSKVTRSSVEVGLFQLEDVLVSRTIESTESVSPEYWFELPADVLVSVCAELETYLGRHAARELLARAQRTSHTTQQLVNFVEPVMSGFLGTKGGSAVGKRVAFLCGLSSLSTSTPVNHHFQL